MAGANKVRIGHDDIYEATAVVLGGKLVVPAAGATNAGVQGIATAGAGASDVLGVSARRAEPVASQGLTGTDADGYPVVYPNTVNELTAVYKRAVVEVTYTASAVAFGKKLKSAAAGAVALWVSGTDAADLIIGECRVVGGMGAGGGAGLAYIY
jgi:hypothetical protein